MAIGPNSPGAGELIPIKFDHALAGSGIPVATVSGAVVERLFAGHDQTLQKVQTGLDQENPHVLGAFALEGVRVKLATSLVRKKGTGRNVLAYLPPGTGSEEAPIVVIGAHYDHIGHGEIGSLAKKGEEGMIHNGADDNASGTSVVLALAEALAAQRNESPGKLQKGILFAAWSGEEIGIIGSNYWMDNPTVDAERVAVYLNFDMVGRLRENLVVQGLGSSPAWAEILERAAAPLALSISPQQDSYVPTDATSFYTQGVPVLNAFTGAHSEYHTPRDTLEFLNFEGTAEIGELFARIAEALSRAPNVPAYQAQQSPAAGLGRTGFRVFLGTVPDYAQTEVSGVRLSGVAPAGPAKESGIRGGDIIVEVDGRTIENLYDYTYALEALRVGIAARIVVLRENQRVELEVVPGSRD